MHSEFSIWCMNVRRAIVNCMHFVLWFVLYKASSIKWGRFIKLNCAIEEERGRVVKERVREAVKLTAKSRSKYCCNIYVAVCVAQKGYEHHHNPSEFNSFA